MNRFQLKIFFGKAILCELGAAILFFGSLAHHPELIEVGRQAISELQSRGYAAPTDADPLRVYPANTSENFTGIHAGGWRPGVISLRENPQGNLGADVYFRHELMHEASYRTCGGKLPIWAEEAAAISFSGELATQSPKEHPSVQELEYLKNRIRIRALPDAESYKTLSKLVAIYGWSEKPCEVSKEIEKLLMIRDDATSSDFSYILISLVSGRIFESFGDIHSKYPPGSLLKIPYAASLRNMPASEIGHELAESNTEKLLIRRHNFDTDRYRLLISGIRNVGIDKPDDIRDEAYWRQYLGERRSDGNYPLEASLDELAKMLRAALLSKPEYFSGLSDNGLMKGTTLFAESGQDKKILKQVHAMSKTGTASDYRGHPMVGHLMVVWPAEAPAYLAVFRSKDSNGASNIRRASGLLEQWASKFPKGYGKVRVRLMGLLKRSEWEIRDECPAFDVNMPDGGKHRISLCGRFGILSSAKASRSERMVSGILDFSPDNQIMILETDPETYADAVMASEAQELRGEASKALRAVVVHNGMYGSHRHTETSSLCDTTHCMVFMGQLPDEKQAVGINTDMTLLKLLDKLTPKRDWLLFSKGGTETWKMSIPGADLAKQVNESSVSDIRRERKKNGDIQIHLIYADSEEAVPCEVFRNSLKLPSCPSTIRYDEQNHSWNFEGIGKGHGLGLSVEAAKALSEAGYSASAILRESY